MKRVYARSALAPALSFGPAAMSIRTDRPKTSSKSLMDRGRDRLPSAAELTAMRRKAFRAAGILAALVAAPAARANTPQACISLWSGLSGTDQREGRARLPRRLTLRNRLYRFRGVPAGRDLRRRGRFRVCSMPEPPFPRDEALKRFDERFDALAASSRRTPRQYGSDEGAGAGYRLIGELIGGVLTGLGLGWLLDRFAGTAPFGLIGGVLIGSAAAIYLAVRSAARMSAPPAKMQDSAVTPAKMNEGPDQGV